MRLRTLSPTPFAPPARPASFARLAPSVPLALVAAVCLLATIPAARAAGQQAISGQRHLNALRSSYPNIIDAVRYIDNDWSIEIDGRAFYWAQSRLLPQEALATYASYSRIPFYSYYRGEVRMPVLTADQEMRLRQLFSRQNRAAPTARLTRHNDFLDTLYGINTRLDAENLMVVTTFLDRRITIHPFLTVPLGKIERKILRRIGQDAELRAFIAELHSVSGFAWRAISGTNARSYHGYGAAIDLLHDGYDGKHVYWRWSAEQGVEEWWKIPLERRWMPPAVLIEIFESEGFVWGGKWLLFDNLHFEYRPEIFHLLSP